MNKLDTKIHFLELRAQGWSLERLAKKLHVAKRTLVDWNHQLRNEIDVLAAIEFEALQERILTSREHELTCLADQLKKIQDILGQRDFALNTNRDLLYMAALIRAEIRKICSHRPLLSLPGTPPPAPPANSPLDPADSSLTPALTPPPEAPASE